MDYDQLLDKLRSARGNWERIAERAGVDRATVARMMYWEGYSPTVKTARAVEAAMRELGLLGRRR